MNMGQNSRYLDILNVLLEIDIALKKASYMHEELTGEYFSKPNILKDREMQMWIIADYNRNGVFAEIVEDNIRTIEKKLKEVRGMVNTFVSEGRKE